jgi:hypothetical protein
MKLSFLVFVLLVISCDPHQFGFKKNPAYVLDTAFLAIKNLDQETFLEVSGKEVLCLYGTQEGINFLKEKLEFDTSDIKLKPTLLSFKNTGTPEYVGYWSYFSERYLIDVVARSSKELLLQAVTDCHYGTMGKRTDNQQNLNRADYPVKECRLVKIIPKTFKGREMPAKCEILRVDL